MGRLSLMRMISNGSSISERTTATHLPIYPFPHRRPRAKDVVDKRSHHRPVEELDPVEELAVPKPTIDPARSDMRRAVRPFVYMVACSAVLALGLLLIKIFTSFPGIQYVHLLVNYDFGMIKRALVGAVVGLVRPRVGLLDVYVVGLAVWLAALLTYLAVRSEERRVGKGCRCRWRE